MESCKNAMLLYFPLPCHRANIRTVVDFFNTPPTKLRDMWEEFVKDNPACSELARTDYFRGRQKYARQQRHVARTSTNLDDVAPFADVPTDGLSLFHVEGAVTEIEYRQREDHGDNQVYEYERRIRETAEPSPTEAKFLDLMATMRQQRKLHFEDKLRPIHTVHLRNCLKAAGIALGEQHSFFSYWHILKGNFETVHALLRFSNEQLKAMLQALDLPKWGSKPEQAHRLRSAFYNEVCTLASCHYIRMTTVMLRGLNMYQGRRSATHVHCRYME